MRLMVNGRPREVVVEREPVTVLEFLRTQQIEPRLVAVAVNGDVVEKHRYGEATIREGDVVEVVRMVGGGAVV
jgi:sulfur carrier protein